MGGDEPWTTRPFSDASYVPPGDRIPSTRWLSDADFVPQGERVPLNRVLLDASYYPRAASTVVSGDDTSAVRSAEQNTLPLIVGLFTAMAGVVALIVIFAGRRPARRSDEADQSRLTEGSRKRPRKEVGMKRLIVVSVVLAVVAAGAAMATPGSGVTAEVLATGTMREALNITAGAQTDVVTQHVLIAPGGHTGWHSHPGPAVVLVKAGALTLYQANDPRCIGTTFRAGRSFVDPGRGNVHIGRNERAEPVELFVTYFDVPIGGAFRVDALNPGNCAF